MATLGIDLGGTKLLACIVGDDARPRARVLRPTGRGLGPDAALASIREVAAELGTGGAGAVAEIDAVGIGFPGLVDPRAGVARRTPLLDGWHDEPFAARVAAVLGVPAALDNDVNNAARAEQHVRAGDATRDFLFVAIGTGIGAALVLGGRLWHGASGLAGELGHMSIERGGPRCPCGRRGCLVALASGSALEQRLGLAHGELARALAGGRADALAALRDAADALGHGLASAMNLLNLPLLVLGGGVAELGAPYLESVEFAFRREAFPEVAQACRIEPARAGYEAGAIGAALLAREASSR